MSKYKNIKGNKYGYVTVLEYTRTIDGAAYWKCKCDCGKEIELLGSEITRPTRAPTKSCGCMRGKHFSASRSNKDPQKVMRNNIYNVFRRNARKRKLTVSISYEEWLLLSQQPCYYCGRTKTNCGKNKYRAKYPTESKREDFYYNGIDRLDSTLHYSPGNCVPCCRRCNFAKGTMDQHDFYQFIKDVYNYLGLEN